jgi:hypothetical protein
MEKEGSAGRKQNGARRSLCTCHKGIWENGGIAAYILNLGTKWMSVLSLTPWPLYLQRKRLWYSMNKSLHGPQWWS